MFQQKVWTLVSAIIVLSMVAYLYYLIFAETSIWLKTIYIPIITVIALLTKAYGDSRE